MKPVIRPMTSADLDRIDELEKQIFPDSWPVTAFEEHLDNPGAGGVVALNEDITIGVLVAFLNYNAILFRPVVLLGQFYQQLQEPNVLPVYFAPIPGKKR